jgi:hypothetical protein
MQPENIFRAATAALIQFLKSAGTAHNDAGPERMAFP